MSKIYLPARIHIVKVSLVALVYKHPMKIWLICAQQVLLNSDKHQKSSNLYVL